MKNLFVFGALTAGIYAGAAQAVEVTGGYVDLGYSGLTDQTDFQRYNLNGAGEIAFSRSVGLQLDLGAYRFNSLDETVTNATLHGVFHVSPNGSLGVFYGQENLPATNGFISEDFRFFGIEGGYDAGQVDIEGYLGRQDVDVVNNANGTIFGISVNSYVTDSWELSLNYDLVDNIEGALDISTLSIGADYDLSPNAKVYGEVGNARYAIGNGSTNETYVGVGVRINLGASRGTTFGTRGVAAKIPGL